MFAKELLCNQVALKKRRIFLKFALYKLWHSCCYFSNKSGFKNCNFFCHNFETAAVLTLFAKDLKII